MSHRASEDELPSNSCSSSPRQPANVANRLPVMFRGASGPVVVARRIASGARIHDRLYNLFDELRASIEPYRVTL